MGNRIQSALQAVNRRKRGVASVVSVAAIGTLALGTLGAGTAVAHGMVDSERIQNQTIQTQDIGQNGVGASEVGPNAIHKWNINQNSVGAWELHPYAQNRILGDGRVQENHLSDEVAGQLGEQTSTDSTSDLDGQTDLPADSESNVASLDVSESALVIGHLTASSSAEGNNIVCSLMSGDGPIAEANEKLGPDGQQNGSMTLAGVAEGGGTVNLSCHSDSGDAFVTDVTLSTVNLG